MRCCAAGQWAKMYTPTFSEMNYETLLLDLKTAQQATFKGQKEAQFKTQGQEETAEQKTNTALRQHLGSSSQHIL